MDTPILPFGDDAAFAHALAILADGGLVALPTETVYGLAADATEGTAVARIFEAKGRPSFNPLIAHVSSREMADAIASFDPVAERLAGLFWPGPLTLVLPARESSRVHPLVQAGLSTIAVRMPVGRSRSLIERFGRPLAAPSANRSGRVSPTTAAHVHRTLGGRIDLILDGGPCDFGLESTILRPVDGRAELLRPGSLSAEEISDKAGIEIVSPSDPSVVAPGQLRSHYAPAGRLRLDVASVEPDEHLIAFGPAPLPGAEDARETINLSVSGDLREAAANLFDALSRFDSPSIRQIAVAPVPRTGLGAAINDRLQRAAAPR